MVQVRSVSLECDAIPCMTMTGLTFIEQEDLGVSDQGTSDSDPLLLSSRQLRSLVTYERVKAIGQADNKVVLEKNKRLQISLARARQTIRLGLAYDVGVLASLNQLFLRHFSGRFVRAEPV